MHKNNTDLYFIYLEDDDEDFKKVKHLSNEISKDFNNYNEKFVRTKETIKDKFRQSVSQNPPVAIHLKLIRVRNMADMKNLLFESTNLCTDITKRTVFFILDYLIKEPGSDSEKNLSQHRIDGIPFYIWLETYFPHLPKILFSSLPRDLIQAPENYFHVPKGDLEEENKMNLNFGNFFIKWWTPEFWEALVKYVTETGSVSFHTPGHNSGNAFSRSLFLSAVHDAFSHFSFRADLSVSVDELGDLSEPEDDSKPMSKARKKASPTFGSQDTYFITNGTSTSNKAMLMTLMEPGDIVIVDRNCHKSIHQAIVMSGARPYYLNPSYHEYLGFWLPLSREQWKLQDEVIEKIKPKMMILTTCTYEGIHYPVHEIARYCESHNILFYADEAWAPYNRFHPYYTGRDTNGIYRYSAIDGRMDFDPDGNVYGRGAHMSVQSTHKALAAFSQASMIHISKRFRALIENNEDGWEWLSDRFRCYDDFTHKLTETLRYWHSTSPNYPMIATLDLATTQMRLEGMSLLDERLKWVRKLKEAIHQQTGECIFGLKDLVYNENAYTGYLKDDLKFIAGFNQNRSESATEFKHRLETHVPPIKYEKDTHGYILFLITVGTFSNHLENLKDIILKSKGLLQSPDYNKLIKNGLPPDQIIDNHKISGNLKVLPRVAVQSKGEMTDLSKSENRVAAQMVVPYPPGIPVILPGMSIDSKIIELIEKVIETKGYQSVHGLQKHDNSYRIKVMDENEADKNLL